MSTLAETSISLASARVRRRDSFLATLIGFDARFRQRRAFDRLDPHLRRDVGLEDTRAVRKHWDAPDWWR